MVDGVPVLRQARLTLVDLAGTDRATPRDPHTFAINLSLTKLKKVANELSLRQQQARLEVQARLRAEAEAEVRRQRLFDQRDGGEDSHRSEKDDDDDSDDRGYQGNGDRGSANDENDDNDDADDDDYGNHRNDSDDDDDDDHDDNNRHLVPAVPPIAYKETVLTYLLRDHLSGDCRTLLVAAVSPTEACREASVSSLAFAEALRTVHTQPQVHNAAHMI